jgi:hypothetical protein
MLLDSPVVHRIQSNKGALMVVLTFEVTTPSELLKVPGTMSISRPAMTGNDDETRLYVSNNY